MKYVSVVKNLSVAQLICYTVFISFLILGAQTEQQSTLYNKNFALLQDLSQDSFSEPLHVSVEPLVSRCGGQLHVQLTASGGNPPYLYSLNGASGPFVPLDYNPLIISLAHQLAPYEIVICDSTILYPCQYGPVQIVVPAPLTIDSIQVPQVPCVTGLVTVFINTSGGTQPLYYFVDGVEKSGPTFTVTPGTHTAMVVDSEEPYPCSVSQTFSTPPICPPSNNLLPNILYPAGTYTNGAPIQSVAWSTITDECPYALAAIGGYKSTTRSCTSVSIRVYILNNITQKLELLFTDLPTDYVFSVTWCCINGTPYLAVAGCPNQLGQTVWIYRYNSEYNTIEFVTSSSIHQNTIYSIAWLTDQCTSNPDIRNLAVSGEPFNGVDIQILQLNALNGTLSSLGSTSFGAPVYSLDWCKATNNCAYLAAGGKAAPVCGVTSSLKLYLVSCNGDIILLDALPSQSTIRTVKWCCSTGCTTPILVAGGDKDSTDNNIKLYAYNARTHKLVPCAHQLQPEKVFALEWLEGCDCTNFVAGSGCMEGSCIKNIVIYTVDRCTTNHINILTSAHFDDNITSLAATKVGDITFILAGSESNNFNPLNPADPLCPISMFGKELALYKGIFCKPTPKPCLPTPACERNVRVH